MIDQETVRQVISRIPLEDGVFLAGGQALNFWAEHYARAPELKHYGPYTSKDVDFFGRYQAAEKLAEALGGHVEKPTASGPEAFVEAVVVVPDGDGEFRIDFLNYVLGTDPGDLEKKRVEIRPLVIRDGEVVGQLQVPIMHPFHVLQSRIANVIKLGNNQVDQRSTRQRQAMAAPIILREYVRDRVAAGGLDEVRGILRELHHWLRRDAYGRQARSHVDYDPLQILEEHRGTKELDERWIEHNLAGWIEDVTNHRNSIGARLAALAQRAKQLGLG